jgi:hypothetical protein
MNLTKEFVRTQSGALVSKDKDGLNSYKANREVARKKQREIKTMKSNINRLERKVDGMETLLKQILDKVSN